MELDNFYITHSHHLDEDLGVIEGYGSVESYLTEEDSLESVGSFTYHIYNMYAFSNEQSLLWTSDAISGDELFMIDVIQNGESDVEMDEGGMLVTIEHVFIEEKFDQYENEKRIVQKMIEYFEYMMLDYVAVIATKSEKYPKEKKGVVSFPQVKLYESLGFQCIGGLEKKHPVWMRNLHVKI